MISVLSSVIASDCASDEHGVVVRNPGRALFSPAAERERLRLEGSPSIRLPRLIAVITLLSDLPGPFDYRLTCALTAPEGEVDGSLQSVDFHWPEDQRIERVSVNLDGRIPFFEVGGVYKVRFLLNGDPLCEIPLP